MSDVFTAFAFLSGLGFVVMSCGAVVSTALGGEGFKRFFLEGVVATGAFSLGFMALAVTLP